MTDAPLIGSKPSHGLACGECACWVPIANDNGNMGQCKLNPPTVFPIMGQDMAGRPGLAAVIPVPVTTRADDWCAQHTIDLGDAPEFLTS